MATVWLGRPIDGSARFAALKVIRAEHARNKDFIAMFVDEARIASRLTHPNIVRLFGLGHDGARHFLAMEVLRGCTLLGAWEAARARGLRVAYEVAAWIGARIADALEHAHELRGTDGSPQHVVHRDVNPSNIFLGRDGTPKLIDFGIAKARDRIASTAAGVVKGKLAYLSPEQTHGHPADRRADIFALSVSLWELTLDRRLFREDSDVATIRRVREAHVPDPTTLAVDYPRALADAIVRGLARDPRERWQTAAQLRDALDAFVAQSARRVDEGSVRSIVAELLEGHALAEWERLADEREDEADRIRAWDDDRQKLTWMQASVETLTLRPQSGARPPAAGEAGPETRLQALRRLIAAREPQLRDSADRVALARLHLESAIVEELLGDTATAAAEAKKALDESPSAFAHSALRRLAHSRGAARSLALHLDAEIEMLPADAPRADLLAERARLLEAAQAPRPDVRAAWERALAVDAKHPAALRGLEVALAADPEAREALSAHLLRMAEAYAAEPPLAAWLLVERALLLDQALGQPDAAKGALQRALALDPGLGPVRTACVASAVVRRDAAWLVSLLEEEASLETDEARAAVLEVEAGCVARRRLGDVGLAIALFERAVARSAAPPSAKRRALDDLVALHESAGRMREALRVRRLRLSAVDDPRVKAHELRAIAGVHDAMGDAGSAITALEQALALTPGDTALAEALDRILDRELMAKERSVLWSRLAVGAEGAERARRLVRAARLAEAHGDREQAVLQLRAALVSDPTYEEASDALLRLLAIALPQPSGDDVRARIAVHSQAAEQTGDPARRIAHLEAVALLQEELLSDAAAAAATYESILRVERRRRSAVVGLARTAARAGDLGTSARALLEEADTTTGVEADALRLRAAEALRAGDPERALSLVRDVLSRDPGHEDARSLEQRLHEAAGRWTLVDATLGARIEHAKDARTRVELLLARAELQRTSLRAPIDAIASLRAALAIDPGHPAAREALLELLEQGEDPRGLRESVVALAARESTPEARSRALAFAAEIDEFVLVDDAGAADLLSRAFQETPTDSWVEHRRERIQLRVAPPDDGPTGLERDAEIAEREVETQSASARWLRALERAARISGDLPRLADALERQASAFAADSPRIGALWTLASLVQWRLPVDEDGPVIDRILKHAPSDRAALDAAVRGALAGLRRGDPAARTRATSALRALASQPVGSETDRWCINLAAGLALERDEIARDDDDKAALAHYREALRIDPRTVIGAVGASRLASALDDVEATIAASIAQGEIAAEPRQRATLLVGAAGRVLSALDPRIGTRSERLARAGDLLEKALDADAEALPAVGLLVAVRSEDGQRDRLLRTLRSAFDRAQSRVAIVHIGGEIARTASREPTERGIAIECLRRVLSVERRHGPTLRALADLYVAQSAWGEAVEALEWLAASDDPPTARLAAEFELAELYGRVLARPADVERVLRAALEIDPASVIALRRLLAHLRTAGAPPDQLGALLARIGDAETEPEAKATALTELAQVRQATGDAMGAEQALVEALAQAPTTARLARVFDLHAEGTSQAHLLSAAVARSEALDRPHPLALAALGRLEVETLGRWADGVAHLRAAAALAPTMHDARAALALGLLRMGVAAEAVGLLLPMVTAEPRTLLALDDPARALATLEGALAAEARHEEAIVARELRALCGGLDDGSLAALRARRIQFDAESSPAAVLGAQVLRTSVVPREADSLLLDLAAALAGAEAKLSELRPVSDDRHGPARDRPDLQRVTVRGRVAPASGHPVLALLQRLTAQFGTGRPEIAIGERGAVPRLVVVQDAVWIAVPATMLDLAEPDLSAMLVPLFVRLTLAVPWLEDHRGLDAHALLCGAARLVVPGYASEGADPEQSARVDEMARRVGKALGRRQKKALAELAPALRATRAPTPKDVAAWEDAVRRTELRAAFVATGDLLSTIGAARAADERLAQATAQFSPSALGATLLQPQAGDVVRFALAPATTALRWRAGSLWTRKH